MLWVISFSDGTVPFRGVVGNPEKTLYRVTLNGMAAIRSARANTSLDIAVMYDGDAPEFLSFLKDQNVRCIQRRFTHAEDPQFFPDHPHQAGVGRHIAGMWMRTEIPLVFPEHEYVLYTDTDVIFTRDPVPQLEQVRPKFVAGCTEGACSMFPAGVESGSRDAPWVLGAGFINTGVLVINTKAWADEYDAFVETSRSTGWGAEITADEGVINLHFKDRVEYLRRTFNWRPWWGIFEAAPIVHYHGSKVADLREYLEWGIDSPDLSHYCKHWWQPSFSRFAVDMTRDIAQYYVDLYEKYNS